MMVTSGYARVNGARLYFEVQGSGPPLVLLSDGPESSDAPFDSLAESFQVIRYDLRGSGKSSEIADLPFSHSDDLLELLDHLSVRTATLAELTPGATIADEFIAQHPERVSLIVPIEFLLHPTTGSGRSTR
ncbi:MAG TPA: alpha/beta hydrolase [Candidatus Kapabacteria bacterium]|nr:alpha/beta hydrolase [Candidatus Kapabacteria bacterium]